MAPAAGMGFGFSLADVSSDGGAAPVNVGATGRAGGIFAIEVELAGLRWHEGRRQISGQGD